MYMLDPYVRTLIDPPLHFVGKKISACGISPNTVTLIGFFFGLLAMGMIALGSYAFAVGFFCVNRLADGLDGAVARHRGRSDFGGLLDIVCDFIIYAGIVFAFSLNNPKNSFYAAFLIFSFVGPITSFLAYAILASKRNLTSEKRGKKSFYYLGGMCEGTETASVLLLMCIFPRYFWLFCLIYGALCWLTTVGRVYCAWIDFKDHDEQISTENSYTESAELIKSQGQ